MKEKTKVYIYTRVSTAVQVDGYSLDAQKSRMKAYAEFNDFEIVWLLTGGGPANATQILSTYAYTTGFMNLNISKATASAIIAVPAMVLIISLILRYMKTREE